MTSSADSLDHKEEKPLPAWAVLNVQRGTHRLVAEASSRLKQSQNETILQALELLSKAEAPTAQHLSLELLRAAETIELSKNRLANTLDALEAAAFAVMAERLLETENLLRSREHGSDGG